MSVTAQSLPMVHVRFVDERRLELPAQARCIEVPEQMDRRQAALTQNDEATSLVYPHVSGGYYPRSAAAARQLSEAQPGDEVLVEMPGEGLWRAVRVEGGFECPAHKVRMQLATIAGAARLACPRCEAEQKQVAAGAALRGEQTPGIHALVGYAWIIRPLDEAARLCGAAQRYGYGAYEVAPTPDAEHLCDIEACAGMEHLVVTPSVQAPSVPRNWGIEPVRPLRPRMLNSDHGRPAFAVKAAGPVEEICGWSLQRWTYGVGA